MSTEQRLRNLGILDDHLPAEELLRILEKKKKWVLAKLETQKQAKKRTIMIRQTANINELQIWI